MDYRNENPVENNIVSARQPQLIKEWEEIKNLITPGGIPLYICPVCKREESRHLYGIEFLENRQKQMPTLWYSFKISWRKIVIRM